MSEEEEAIEEYEIKDFLLVLNQFGKIEHSMSTLLEQLDTCKESFKVSLQKLHVKNKRNQDAQKKLLKSIRAIRQSQKKPIKNHK